MTDYIEIRTKEEFNHVLTILQAKGWTWCSSNKPLDFLDSCWTGHTMYLEYQNNFGRQHNCPKHTTVWTYQGFLDLEYQELTEEENEILETVKDGEAYV